MNTNRDVFRPRHPNSGNIFKTLSIFILLLTTISLASALDLQHPRCAEAFSSAPDFIAWFPSDEDAKQNNGDYLDTLHGAKIIDNDKRNRVLLFDDGLQKVIAEHDSVNLEAFSVCAWIFMEPNQTRFATIAAEADYSGNIEGWTMRLANGNITVAIGDGSSQVVITVASADSAFSSWHHIALTYDGESISAYFDGDLADQKPADFKDAEGTTTIGWSPLNSDLSHFNGQIDDVYIYGRALESDDVKAHVADCGDGLCEGDETGICPEDCGEVAASCDLSDGTVFRFATDGRWQVTDEEAGSVHYSGKPLLKYLEGESETTTTQAEPMSVEKESNSTIVTFGFSPGFNVVAEVTCLAQDAQVAYTVNSKNEKFLYFDPYYETKIKDPTLARQWEVPIDPHDNENEINYRYPRVSYGEPWYEVFAPAIFTSPENGISLVTGYDLPEGDIIFGQGDTNTFSLPLAKFRPANNQFVYSCVKCEKCDYEEDRKIYHNHGNYLPSTDVSGTYYFGAGKKPDFDAYYRWFADNEFSEKNWPRLHPNAPHPQSALLVWQPSIFASTFKELEEFPDILWSAYHWEWEELMAAGVDKNRLFMKPPGPDWTVVTEDENTEKSAIITEAMIAQTPDKELFKGSDKHACKGGWSDSYNKMRFINHASNGAAESFLDMLDRDWNPEATGKLVGTDGPEFYPDYNEALKETDNSMRKGMLSLLEGLNDRGYTVLGNPTTRDIHMWKSLDFLTHEYLFTKNNRNVDYWTPHYIDGERYGDQLSSPESVKRASKFQEVSKLLSDLPDAPSALVFFAYLGFKKTDEQYAHQLAFVKQHPNVLASLVFGSGGVANGYGIYETAHYTLNQKYAPSIVSEDFGITGASRTIPFGHSVRLKVENDQAIEILSDATHYKLDEEPIRTINEGRIVASLASGDHHLRVWSAQDGFIIDVEKLDPGISFVLGRPFVRKDDKQVDGYSLYAIKGNFEEDANIKDKTPNPSQLGKEENEDDNVPHPWRDTDRTRIRYDWVAVDEHLLIDVKLGKAKKMDSIEFLWDTRRSAPVRPDGVDDKDFKYDSSTGVGTFTVSQGGIYKLSPPVGSMPKKVRNLRPEKSN